MREATIAALLALCLGAPALAQTSPTGCLNASEAELAQLVNAYRQENGLDAVPLSETLVAVAQWHVVDVRYAIEVTGDYGSDPSCNLHTWYGIPGAPYSTCCYTSDHAQASCMWSKPAEISQGSYGSAGYENAAWGYATPAAALEGWKNSPGHNAVILNEGSWASLTWKAIGVGVDEIHRTWFLWFAGAEDPGATPVACDVPVTVENWSTLKARYLPHGTP